MRYLFRPTVRITIDARYLEHVHPVPVPPDVAVRTVVVLVGVDATTEVVWSADGEFHLIFSAGLGH